MKNTKRLLAAMTASLLALTPLAATGIMTAVAAGNIGVINITDDSSEHTYTAYPIITGTPDGTSGKLKNLAWAAGFNSTDFITALNTNATRTSLGISTDRTVVPDIVNVDDAAKALLNVTSADQLEALAKLVSNYKGSTGTNLTLTSGAYTAEVADGWYLILDTSTIPTNGVQVKSANILEVSGTSNMTAKHSLPTLEKKIYNGTSEVDANSAAIGDVVTYHINTKVPDMTGYDKYYFVIDDILSPGLTFNPASFAITIDGITDPLAKDTNGDYTDYASDHADYYVTYGAATPATDGTAIKVVFENFKANMKDKNVAAGTDIQISYTATLDSDAVIGDAGNPNKAKLTYSNNPNPTGAGTPDSNTPDEPPASNPPTGVTPWDDVTTYSTAIQVNKIDQSSAMLKGAVFTLTSTDFNEVKVVSGYKFVQNDGAAAGNTYYKLKDGSYTKTAPTGDYSANSLYDETDYNKKYEKVYLSSGDGDNQTIIEKAGSGSYAVEAQVDENGIIRFEGLKPGTYTLHELTPPEGYNAAEDVTITITETDTSDVVNAPSAWTCTGASYVAANNAFSLNVVNRYGATLPTTGGMGTKLLYLFGSVFAIGSATFIVTRKRVNNSK
jgi:fimbrial isopeptide formation D2 family protein